MTKIIIIEDNPTYNTFISKFLAKAGFKSIQVHRLFTAKKNIYWKPGMMTSYWPLCACPTAKARKF